MNCNDDDILYDTFSYVFCFSLMFLLQTTTIEAIHRAR